MVQWYSMSTRSVWIQWHVSVMDNACRKHESCVSWHYVAIKKIWNHFDTFIQGLKDLDFYTAKGKKRKKRWNELKWFIAGCCWASISVFLLWSNSLWKKGIIIFTAKSQTTFSSRSSTFEVYCPLCIGNYDFPTPEFYRKLLV